MTASWGADYPFLSNADRINSIDLFNLMTKWMRMKQCAKDIS